MKTVVTAQGQYIDSMVDPRFGRCSWFIVADSNTGQFKAVSNEKSFEASQGAGIQAADNVTRLGVDSVITGHCGPKAFRVLKAAGKKVYTGGGGTVAEMLDRFKKGELKEAETADVEGHWA
ncbi:MAG: NifB/NifX family molybdenum-iron cluster-binding protein [Actinobacteria bacterium]|nr:NifB/NifX family molybdenum-iron cluster-binding protein [Actinomycetota bacterium]